MICGDGASQYTCTYEDEPWIADVWLLYKNLLIDLV